jgi:NitT/TauT family transport system substrate-binding protein
MPSRRLALGSFGALTLAPLRVGAQAAPVTLKVGHPPTETATPLLYAMRTGLFERAGMKIELTKMSSGAAVSSAVAGGALDLGGTSLLALILGHAKGIPFTIIAAANNMAQEGYVGGLLTQAASPLRDAKDFDGKTVSAAAVNDIVTLSLWAWMDKNGADWRSLKVIEIPQPAAAAALIAGRTDGAYITGAAFEGAVTDAKVRKVANVWDAIAPRYAATAWFSTRDWLGRNHAVAQRFARVLSEAAGYTNTHAEETLPDMVAYTGLDRAVAQKMHRAMFSTTLRGSDIQPLIDAAAKYKFIDQRFSGSELISDVVPQ